MIQPRNSRRLPWLFLPVYLALTGSGLWLQLKTGSTLFGFPVQGIFLEPAVIFIWAVVGALLVSRHPRHPVGWIFFAVSLLVAVDYFTYGYGYYGVIAHPGSLRGAKAAAIWQYWSGHSLGQVPVALLFLLFPTGRPLSSRWWWVAGALVVATAAHATLLAMSPTSIAGGPFPFPTDLLGVDEATQAALVPAEAITSTAGTSIFLVSVSAMFLRLRRARGVERQQLKWFAYAAFFSLPGVLLTTVGSVGDIRNEPVLLVGGALTLINAAGMALASAIAILRYRLFDIDIIIRRTLVYGLLSGALSLLYFVVVGALQGIFRGLTGQNSPVAIVVSTLLIAALLTRLRRRIQEFIDRRFYRRKYDAAQTLARFSASARDEVDLDSLAAELLRVVQETMEPEQVSLWLRGSG